MPSGGGRAESGDCPWFTLTVYPAAHRYLAAGMTRRLDIMEQGSRIGVP
jgi:hypothetical protein